MLNMTEKLYLSNANVKLNKELSEEDEILKIFNQNYEEMEYNEAFNIDYSYGFSRIQSKEICQSDKSQLNKSEMKYQNENDNPPLDDFDFFYNKFTDNKNMNELSLDKEEYKSPSFALSSYFEKELVYSNAEDDEHTIIIENPDNDNNLKMKNKNNKNKKDKIFNIVKKKKQKPQKKIDIAVEIKTNQNNNNKFPKVKKHKNYFHIIDRNNKYFPFTKAKGKGILLCSKEKIENESLTPGIGNPGNDNSSSHNGSSTNEKDFDPPNEKGENNIKDKGKENKKGNEGTHKGRFKENKQNENQYNIDNLGKLNDNFLFLFTTKKYFVAENGKKKRVKKKRKFKPDDIRKKIKARFHKTMKNIINENLKKVGSKELFDFLPQCFIGNVSKKTNSKCFDYTYKQLLSTNFLDQINKGNYRNYKVDQNKFKKNLEVLNYLEKNPEICRKSGFDLIKDRKYKDLLQFYFASAQFENSVIQLKAEKESPEYIQEYIYRARSYVSFYTSVKNSDDGDGDEDKNEINDNDEEDEEKEEDKDNDEKNT